MLESINHKAFIFHYSKNQGSLTLQTNFNVELNMGDLTCLFRDSSYLNSVFSTLFQDAVEGSRPEEIMESTVDASEWKLEVERVTPSLKVHIRTDNKDWRTHVDQMHQHRDGINTALSETKVGGCKL